MYESLLLLLEHRGVITSKCVGDFGGLYSPSVMVEETELIDEP